jgi:hypothetical protein
MRRAEHRLRGQSREIQSENSLPQPTPKRRFTLFKPMDESGRDRPKTKDPEEQEIAPRAQPGENRDQIKNAAAS